MTREHELTPDEWRAMQRARKGPKRARMARAVLALAAYAVGAAAAWLAIIGGRDV